MKKIHQSASADGFDSGDGIAIIGMAGRFPGAMNLDEFWRNLAAGVESISFFSAKELERLGVAAAMLNAPNYVRAKAVLEDVDLFDASFFDFTPREAEVTDPQHRLFLECAWEALEDAGYAFESDEGTVGVFAGSSASGYLINVYSRPDLVKTLGGAQVMIGNDKDHLAMRVSYKLNLRGPSITVQTTCSTSLVATHLACRSLLNGECDMALAGGVSVTLPQKGGYFYNEGGILSPDGRCRVFDAKSAGTVNGNGLGVVVLQRLSDAVADRARIYGIIKASAVNNDGASKVGYLAPGVTGQVRVITEALERAGVEPETINYLEAHGTGTILGDPVEVFALTQVFRARTQKTAFCAIGSVKSNIGHLDAAAGVAGLIKTALALRHKLIPPTINFEESNPQIDFENGPFHVNTKLSAWDVFDSPRRAGVSSFGIGGTNAHVILEEAPVAADAGPSRPWHLLVLSAKTDTALEKATDNLAESLKRQTDAELADVAYTLQVGRKAFSHRRMLVCRDTEDAIETLVSRDPKRMFTTLYERRNKPVFFMFGGQGSQHVNMGLEVYRAEAVFREQIDFCSSLLQPHLGLDLREVLYPSEDRLQEAVRKLSEAAISQPALFMVEYALAKTLIRWGAQPQAMIGHSLGEYVAACLADVFSLEEGLQLMVARGRLMQELPGGLMLAVALSEVELQSLISKQVSLAAVNGPARCVVSGPTEAIESLEALLNARGAACRRLQTTHAFHSSMMTPILERFGKQVARVKLKAPKIPYISNLTGAWITKSEATNPSYWARHLRQTVRFNDGLERILQEHLGILLEIGPDDSLSKLAQQHPNCVNKQLALPCLQRRNERRSQEEFLINTLGRLWLAGLEVDWRGFYDGELRSRVSLPTYPFERKRFWIDVRETALREETVAGGVRDGLGDEPYSSRKPNGGVFQTAEEAIVSKPKVALSEVNGRYATILSSLKDLAHELTGMEADAIDVHSSFFELGVDSLLLIQTSQAIHERFGIDVPYRLLFEDLSTLDALATYIDRELPAQADSPDAPTSETAPLPAQQAPLVTAGGRAVSASTEVALPPDSVMGQIVAQQLEIMSQQLALLRGGHFESSMLSRPLAKEIRFVDKNGWDGATTAPNLIVEAPPGDLSGPSNKESGEVREPFVHFKPIEIGPVGGLTSSQAQYLSSFIERYCKRTVKSKQFAQKYRPLLADPRASLGFRLQWKELIYPLVGERSAGSKLWDIDGNEYVDLAMGFGVHLFGHSPDFILEALERQLGQGIQLGPQSNLAGKVAELICELTGHERVIFCNSGTEAVMSAVRVARAATGRKKIALFAGSYHGSFDGTLAKMAPVSGDRKSVPLAPGTPPGMIEDVMVLDYGAGESLEILEAHIDELAAVLVEPVQSRRPSLQPRDFLRELRRLTDRGGAALILDEVITGFRVSPGGVQQWFGVRADMAIYGKVIGGGMPIGVVAGNSTYMDAFDGGAWTYGDGSYPHARQTFFAGTFFKHPLTMAASLAVLNRLKEGGPGLQQRLNLRTSELVDTINIFLDREQAPIRLESVGSLLCFTSSRDFKFMDLFFHHLVEKGIYVWEGRTCFLSTAHSEEDLNQVALVVQQTVNEMRGGGFLPDTTPSMSGGVRRAGLSSDSTTSHVRPDVGNVDVDPTQPRLAPLTEGQEQIWVVCQIGDHASRAYNESISLRMRGRLDAPAMRKAIQKLVDRHDALRTTFSRDGKYQQILPSLELGIPIVDLSHFGASDRESQTAEWVTREAQQVFNLVDGPLLRARIIKLREEYHYLLLTLHHLIADGWSSGILVRELRSLYGAECQGLVCELPEPMQYSEYAERQRARQLTEKMERAEQYWLDRFADSVPVLELPTDRSRRSAPTFNGACVSLAIDTSIYLSLKSLSGRRGTTVFMTLLGAFTLLLHRLSGQDDLVVGIASAGQISAGGMDVVGHCVNVLPLRSKLSPELSFTEYVSELKNGVLDASESQDYPVTRLINKLNLPSAPGRSPFIAASFNLDRFEPGFSFLDLEVDIITNPSGSAKFDVSWNIIESDKDLLVNCEYNTDLFDEETIRRWAGHFRTLLAEIVINADRRISELSLLTEAEKRQLLAESDENSAAPFEDLCVHQLFERHAASAPDAVAVIFDGEELTYRDLNARANQLAHRLRALGVGPETRVGICAERSPEMVAALLAVLKAGGAFVPLDPEYPRERLAFMIDDAQVSVLLTQQRLALELPEHEAQSLYLDSDRNSLTQESDSNPAPLARGENLAYLIYTSGTTGRPKAVMIEHRNLANCMLASQAWFGFNRDLVMPFICRFSFDIALFELLSPLLVGGASVLLTRQESLDLARLAKVLEKVTFLQSLPSLMRQIVNFAAENEAGRRFDNITQIMMGGDLVPRDLLMSVRRVFPAARIYEGYGPAECAILTTSYLTPNDGLLQRHIIGKPLSNMTVALYDKRNQLVPIGVPGELYIAGAGVGRGYFNRKDLTKERYITVDNRRFYKTGDLARRLPDGNIEFLGRIDNQVKIRGFRIELGEIEWALENHPDVQSAVVTAWEEAPGDKRLVAYLVLDRNATPSVNELRNFLRQTLPEYMAPSAFLILGALPLTPNGKVDREALPAPNQDRPLLVEEFVAPRNPVEEMLTSIWSEVLNIARVGIHDNFFELGGNSLQATQILSRLREEFKVELSLGAFFESPTVAGLSEAVVRSDTVVADGSRMAALSRGDGSLEDLLSEVDQLSDNEARAILSREREGSREGDSAP